MKFWPSDSFFIHTALPLQEVIRRLEEQTEPPKWFRLSRVHKPFEGEVSRQGFKISRIIHYRNSFLPLIRGTYAPGPSGVTVTIRMGLHPLVAAFLSVWCSGAFLGTPVTLVTLLSDWTTVSPMLLVLGGMSGFMWVLVSGGFWLEAKKQKRMLCNLFDP